MSFFIKKNQPNGSIGKSKKRKFIEKPNSSKRNVEVTSSEDEDPEGDNGLDQFSNDEDNETAQEKKVRLAKVYLQEIEREERTRLEDKEISNDLIAQRLRDDYLKQSGKYRLLIADKCKGVDQANIKILKCREQKNTITCLCISSDDQWIFSGSKDGVVVKWSLAEGKKIKTIPFVKVNVNKIKGHSSCILSIAISTDKKFLAVGDLSSNIQIWNPENLEHIGTLKGHKNAITGLCFKPNSPTLYSTSKDKSVRIWNVDEMVFVETLFGHQDAITAIDIAINERPVTGGGRDGTVRVWKVAEESQLVYNAAPGNVDAVKYINHQQFVSGGDDGKFSQLAVWSVLKKKPISQIKSAHGENPTNSEAFWISSVTAVPNSDLIASGSQDGFVRIWKLTEGARSLEKLFEVQIEGFVNALAFTSDAKYLVVGCGRDHRLGRWSVVKTGKNHVLIIPLNF